jgi:CBS domain-containing protein
MQLKDILEPALVFNSEEKLSHVAAKMLEEERSEVIISNGKFKGIVTAEDIVKRSVSDPNKTKISYFVKRIKPLSVETPIEDVMNCILVSDYRTLPVKYKDKIFIVTKPKLLRFIKDEIFFGKKAKDVMSFPYCISSDDSLATAISITKDLNLTRLPVIDEKNRLVGLIDTLSLLKIVIGKHRAKLGERSGKKIKLNKISILLFVKRDFLRVDVETPLKDIVKLMTEKNASTVIVESEGKLSGMITSKDIFKLIGSPFEKVYIRVSGLHDEDPFILSKLNEQITSEIEKLSKILPIDYIAIHVEKHKKTGKRMKYSVHGRLVTEKGNFYAQDFAWDLTKAMGEFLSKIEREVHKKIGRGREYKRRV